MGAFFSYKIFAVMPPMIEFILWNITYIIFIKIILSLLMEYVKPQNRKRKKERKNYPRPFII